VLVAIGIGAILLTVLYATYFSVFRGASSAETLLEDRLRAGKFADRFSIDIHGAFIKAGDERSRFQGGPRGMGSEVSFTSFTYAAVRENSPASGLTGVAYYTEEAPEGLRLRREVWNPYLGERSGAVVLSGVKSFEISYLDGSSWVKAWDSAGEGRLPEAVRATVTLSRGEEFKVLARTMVARPSG